LSGVFVFKRLNNHLFQTQSEAQGICHLLGEGLMILATLIAGAERLVESGGDL